MRTVLIVLGAIVLLFAAYFAYWQYQYSRAESAASAFCASAEIGSDIASVISRLGAQSGVRHGFQEKETRYVAFFPGPIFNAFTCEIELANRKIVSKRVVELQD